MNVEKPPIHPVSSSISTNLLNNLFFIYFDKYEPIPIALIYNPIVIENCFILSPFKYVLILLIISSYIIEHIDINNVVTNKSLPSKDFVFSAICEEFGGVFAFVGMQNPEVGSGALHHNGKFDVDEKCMTLGTMATVQFAADFLNE